MSSHESESKTKIIGFTIIAGSIAGAIEGVVSYPLEYAKTVMQLDPKMAKKGLKYTILHTIKKFGFTGLFRGVSALIPFTIPKIAVRFAAKDISNMYIFGSGSMLRNLCGGIFAGIFEGALVRVIMDTVMIKMIHDRLTVNKYKGLIDGMR